MEFLPRLTIGIKKNAVLALSFGSIFFTPPPAILNSAETARSPVILLDAGHGTLNFDGDVINGGKQARDKTPEHKLTMQMALATGSRLAKQGFEVYFTRTSQRYWRQGYNVIDDNKARAQLAKKIHADAIVSFHCDWDPRTTINGLSTLYGKKDSQRLGALVHRQLIKELKLKNRKLKYDTYTLLDTSEVPAIIIETGFLSNPSDSKKMRDPEFQVSVAKAIETALEEYFND